MTVRSLQPHPQIWNTDPKFTFRPQAILLLLEGFLEDDTISVSRRILSVWLFSGMYLVPVTCSWIVFVGYLLRVYALVWFLM